MSPTNIAVGPGQFGDTTYTKVFVGGLAWETQKETMKNYFEQFGEILEAVVITDKSTGRSKGYGFVTFKEAEAAMRSCVDAAPVIDGRRANCNLASLGVQRSKPSTPKHSNLPAAVGGNVSRNFRVMNAFQAAVGGGGGGGGGGLGTPFTSAAATTFPHYAVHQGIPYNYYGYSAYSGDYAYPASYYNMYGGAAAQYPMYGSNGGGMLTGAAYYPYLNMGAEGGTNTAASIHYPQQHNLFNYSAAINAYPHHYATGAPISLPPATPAVCFAVPQA